MIGGLYTINNIVIGKLRNPPLDTLAFSRLSHPPIKCVIDGGRKIPTGRPTGAAGARVNGTHELGCHLMSRKVIAADDFQQVLGLGRKEFESLKSVSTVHCAACEKAKKVKHSQPARSSAPVGEWTLWEIVYVDPCDPFPPQAGGGHTHTTSIS